MILRPRQIEFVEKCEAALAEYGNTLGVAPTGAGKTVMLSSLVGKYPSAIILQHRDELVAQNFSTFKKINPQTYADLFTANRKRMVQKGVTFAMVQTLMRPKNLERMRPVDMLCVDECHHARASGYKAVIDKCRELNPDVKIFGVTATPLRGDRKSLRSVFTNVGDVITLAELIQAGHLVRPRTFVVDCGIRDDLNKVRVTANDFDMEEVEKIMDKQAINRKIVEEWQKVACDRSTILFCSTVEHAKHVTDAFIEAGVTAETVYGDMAESERRGVLRRLNHFETQVVVNVAVLTEGFDQQTLGCVGLLRPCSHKSTMLQMIGRGLRKVDPEKFPGFIKNDAIILDFGYSLLTHGNLDVDAQLQEDKKPVPVVCANCGALIPPKVLECPLCGAEVKKRRSGGGERIERGELEEFTMTEVELLEVSPYRWEDLWEGVVTIAEAHTAFAACIYYEGRWVAVGAISEPRNQPCHLLDISDSRFRALSSADDYLREHGNPAEANKKKTWLSMPATDKQLEILNLDPISAFGTNRYRASCLITWKFNEKRIRAAVENGAAMDIKDAAENPEYASA